MPISNPISDAVFKYLMEDLDIAKGLLATILEVEMVALSLQLQETVAETYLSDRFCRTY